MSTTLLFLTVVIGLFFAFILASFFSCCFFIAISLYLNNRVKPLGVSSSLTLVSSLDTGRSILHDTWSTLVFYTFPLLYVLLLPFFTNTGIGSFMWHSVCIFMKKKERKKCHCWTVTHQCLFFIRTEQWLDCSYAHDNIAYDRLLLFYLSYVLYSMFWQRVECTCKQGNQIVRPYDIEYKAQ